MDPIPDAPPPSYDSLQAGEQANGAKQETATKEPSDQDPLPVDGTGEGAATADPEAQATTGDNDDSLFAECCGGIAAVLAFVVGVLACLGLGIAVPVVEVYFGSRNLESCEAQRYLPIYLVVSGSMMFIAGGGGTGCKAKESDDDAAVIKACRWCFYGVIFLFSFCWLICGSVWVFPMKECTGIVDSDPHCFTYDITHYVYQEHDLVKTSYPYCDQTIYRLTYWVIITKWIVIALVLIIALVVLAGTYICKCFNDEEKAEEESANPEGEPAISLTDVNPTTT